MGILCSAPIAFLLGAVPFSLRIGRLALNSDIRRTGDANPAAVNLWRAGSWRVGLPALLLDCLKGAVLVGLARFRLEVSGWALTAIALAPMLGHAFSPFLRFRGCKAVAVSFGVWTGLTLAAGPMVLGAFLRLLLGLQTADAWSVVVGMACVVVYLVIRRFDCWLLAVGCGNLLVLLWTHRRDQRQPLRLRSFLTRHLGH